MLAALFWSFLLPAVAVVVERWRLAPGGLLLVGGLALAGWVVAVDHADVDAPRVDTLFWLERVGAEHGRWATLDESEDEWTVGVLGDDRAVESAPPPLSQEVRLLTAPAPAAGLPGPDVRILRDDSTASGRRLELLIRSRRGASVLRAQEGYVRQTDMGKRFQA
jgi:hypothetical protein